MSTMVTSPIKLGFIGLSTGGASWAEISQLPYFKRSADYKIAALLNSSQESAEKSAKHHGLTGANCYGNIEDLVADANIDMIAISIKVPDHAKMIEPALKARKNIFVEWPLASNLGEVERLAALAKQNKVKTMVGLQSRRDPVFVKAKAMIDDGKLGDILGSIMTGTGGILGPTLSESNQYILTPENGANLITIPAGHALDVMCSVLGEMSDLQATLAKNRSRISLVDSNDNVVKEVDNTLHDYMAVTGHLQRGGIASVIYRGGQSQTGKNFYWEINGTKGSLVFEGDSGNTCFQPRLSFVPAEQDARVEAVEYEEVNDLSFNVGLSWDVFAGEKDGEAVMTFEDALLRHRMIDAIFRSDRKGTRESYV